MTTTATKERGILMHARSVLNIPAGRKTQTRRIVKWQDGKPPKSEVYAIKDGYVDLVQWADTRKCMLATVAPGAGEVGEGFVSPAAGMLPVDTPEQWARCPHGQPGDRLWVRETWGAGWRDGHGGYSALQPTGRQHERPDKVFYKADYPADDEKDGKRCWRPSIFMPRWASRITLEIVSVRVERVQDISEVDCAAEGVGDEWTDIGPDAGLRDAFRDLWDYTNGKGAWDRNDWCWCIEFKVVTPARRRE